jgi:tetratricopeptide (TPR) repeat protein
MRQRTQGPRGCSGAVLVMTVALLSACGRQSPAVPAEPPEVVAVDLSEAQPELQRRVAAAQERVRADRADARAWAELAQLYHANGYADAALSAYGRLRQLEPKEPRWAHLEAVLNAGFGQLDVAQPAWRRVVELQPEYLPAWLKLGDLLIKSNQPVEAQAAYQAVIAVEPDNPWALHGLARIAADDGRWPEARRWLERATREHPNFFAANNLLATVYDRLGLREAAEGPRQRARAADRFREPPDPWVAALADSCFDVYLLQVAAAAGATPERTALLLERARELAPTDRSVLRQLGLLRLRQGDRVAARALLAQVIALKPDVPGAYLDLLTVYKLDGDEAGARRLLERAQAETPASAGVHHELALLDNAQGRADEAVAHLEAARRLSPDSVATQVELARHYFRLARFDEALALVEEALARDPSHAGALLLLARHHLFAGRYAEAENYWQRARRSGPPTPELENLHREFIARTGRAPR